MYSCASVRAWSSVKSLACLFQRLFSRVSKLSRVSAVIYRLRHVRERMSDLRRQQRLERRRQRYRERRGAETPAEKERRLQNERARRRRTLLGESAEAKEARLERQQSNERCERQRERLAAETTNERAARLQHDQESHRGAQSDLPLFEQPAVRARMCKFHAHLTALESPRCTTCSEAFPGLQLRSQSTECLRCSRDKHTPKLYSIANNMDPGLVPPQLQVRQTSCFMSYCHTTSVILLFLV